MLQPPQIAVTKPLHGSRTGRSLGCPRLRMLMAQTAEHGRVGLFSRPAQIPGSHGYASQRSIFGRNAGG